MARIKPNACPHCGDRLKKISGLWRCEKDQYNAPLSSLYPHEYLKEGRIDARPFEWFTGRVIPIIEDD